MVSGLLTFNQVAERRGVKPTSTCSWLRTRGSGFGGGPRKGAFVERENKPGSSWLPTGEDENAFWLHQAAFEFLSSRFPAHRSQNDATRAQAEEVLGATEPLPCGEWRWPGLRQQMRYRGDSLAMVCDDGELWWLMVGGPDEAALEWTADLSLTWDESDSRRPA